MAKILIVEDENKIARFVELELKYEGYEVEIAGDGRQGLEKAMHDDIDLVILDIMLPGLSGIEVCRRVRQEGKQVPIIMLTAKDDVTDKVAGLDMGADDYMTKPFSSREVVSKVKAIIRRREVLSAGKGKSYLSYQRIRLDSSRFEVLIDDQVVDFTLKEYELLEFLIQHKGQALSRDVLLDRLWGFEYDGDTRIVDVHIFKIRDKLKPYGIKIKTIRGVGYMLEDEAND